MAGNLNGATQHGFEGMALRLYIQQFDHFLWIERVAQVDSRFANFKTDLQEINNFEKQRMAFCQFFRYSLFEENVLPVFLLTAIHLGWQEIVDFIERELKEIENDKNALEEERRLAESLLRTFDEYANFVNTEPQPRAALVCKGRDSFGSIDWDESLSSEVSENRIENYNFIRNLSEQGSMSRVSLYKGKGNDANRWYVIKSTDEGQNAVEKVWFKREV